MWCASQPIHQSSMPPSVLPAVATAIALQNRSGLSFSSPNNAGSEPMGSSVAEMKEATNSVLRPYSGSASKANSVSIQDGMRADVIGVLPAKGPVRQDRAIRFQALKRAGP